jgi:PII-like signaling protein
LHEETFFELAGELAVKVEFVVDEELAEKLLDSLHAEDLKILYIRQQIEVAQI